MTFYYKITTISTFYDKSSRDSRIHCAVRYSKFVVSASQHAEELLKPWKCLAKLILTVIGGRIVFIVFLAEVYCSIEYSEHSSCVTTCFLNFPIEREINQLTTSDRILAPMGHTKKCYDFSLPLAPYNFLGFLVLKVLFRSQFWT